VQKLHLVSVVREREADEAFVQQLKRTAAAGERVKEGISIVSLELRVQLREGREG
jgi:hypothetical protein